MASKKNNGKAKRKKRLLILGLSSLIIIGAVTFTVGHYWIEIYDKYQEKKELEDPIEAADAKETSLEAPEVVSVDEVIAKSTEG